MKRHLSKVSSSNAVILFGFLKLCFLGTVFSIALVFTPEVKSRTTELDPSRTQLCYDAISHASAVVGVPKDVLLAISLTETGKKLEGQIRPWPWTVNMEGKGDWFSDQGEALNYVMRRYHEGARSFDVGCFQINYRWHHQNFRTIEDMFDPAINATYAAKFLKDLYLETGSWERAAGYYHSRTPEIANRYRERFSRYRARLASNNSELSVFQGHGSETLRVISPQAFRTTMRPYAPLMALGPTNPPKSAHTSVQGSLFRSQDHSRSLLRRSNSPLF